jgi:hypothetical protein
MRTVRIALAALGLAAIVTSPTFAQGRGGRGGFGFGGPGALLSNKSVQEELKLDEKQAEGATKIAADSRAKRQEAMQGAQGLEGQERLNKMTELMKPINEETEKAVAALLKPEQLKRYKEIELQQRGVQAFGNADLQTELKLTDEQKEKIRAIQQEYAPGRGRGAGGGGGGGDPAAARERMLARRKEAMDKVMAVLNDDQKKAWNEKIGKPFEIKYEPRPNNN